MVGNKTIASVVIALGVLILLASALADIVGLGGSPQVFGYRQIAGSLVGAIIGALGVVLYWWAGRET